MTDLPHSFTNLRISSPNRTAGQQLPSTGAGPRRVASSSGGRTGIGMEGPYRSDRHGGFGQNRQAPLEDHSRGEREHSEERQRRAESVREGYRPHRYNEARQRTETPACRDDGRQERQTQYQGYSRDGTGRGGRRNWEGRSNNGRGRGAGGRDGRNIEGGRQTYERTFLSPVILQQLSHKEPADIVMYLNTSQLGFRNTINAPTLGSHMMQLLIRVIAKACDSPMSQSLVVILNTIKDSRFLSQHLGVYINKMPQEKSGRTQEEFPVFIRNTIRFLQEMFKRLPNSYDALLQPLASVQVTVQILQALNIVQESDVRGLDELIRLRDEMMLHARTGTNIRGDPIRQDKEDNNSDVSSDEEPVVLQPPNDFREISIYPENADVLTKVQPFVRPNIVRGTYQDLDHYLDVQFRLYREDFMAPLREGIDEYITQLRNRDMCQRRIQDIRVYSNAEIVGPLCTNQGLLHTLQFDVSRLKGVNWEFTKRLIFGAFLCLSNDDFKSMYFATVANRKAKNLQEGLIDVKFVGGTDTVARLMRRSQTKPFTMVETSAYFESYHHVLKGLQQITETDLPFQQYLLRCENDVQPPRYMQRRLYGGAVTFDLSPILASASSLASIELDSASDSDDNDDDLTVNSFLHTLHNSADIRKAKEVQLLKLEQWPDAESLGLDESQLQAVQTALTKEISVIQGPPGTGKTYIGLKIAHALLHNRSVWNKGGNQPLLVVCYTNHALDQFLEGILQFHKKGIVRAGTRSGSEKLKKFMLSEIKHTKREARVVPTAIYRSGRAAKGKMEDIEGEISGYRELIDIARSSLLKIHNLAEFMMSNHILSLNRYRYMVRGSKYTILHYWLGVIGAGNESFPEDQFLGGDDDDNDDDSDDDDDSKKNGSEQTENRQDVAGLDGTSEYQVGAKVDTEADVLERERFGDNEMEIFSSRRQHPQPVHEHQMQRNRQAAPGGWQTVENKKKIKRRIYSGLRGRRAMNDREARAVMDIWQLSFEDRWRLYRHWLKKYTKHFQEQITDLEKRYETEAQHLEEINFEEDLNILKEATVIGMTTTGAARYRSILQRVAPKIIIVEEAAEVLEAHVITTLTSSCEQLILIGDHKQLRPNPTVYKLAKDYNLDYSLFERMVKNGMHWDCLELQHRMRPEIAVLMDHIYDGLRNHESVNGYPNIKGVASNLYFIDHQHPEVENEELLSHANDHEARYVTALCRYFLLQGYDASTITVLTTYKGQLFKLKAMMRNKHIFNGVRVTAVDNFQGEENDIIILSLVRSNKSGKIGFLATENRICVALSRAKVGFYCIGNISMLAQKSSLWTHIKHDMTDRGWIGKALQLKCQNHPDTKIDAITDEDFRAAPEGGCTIPCEARLKCGHVCVLPCHPGDPDHLKYKCQKPCIKTVCHLKHKCSKRCYEECGPCMTKLKKVIPSCKHIQDVPCSKKPEDFVCLEACKKTLSCGHLCKNICGVTCMTQSSCREIVTRTWPCGHEVETKCGNTPDTYPCPIPCDVVLQCEHTCPGSCGQCKRGRLHIQCKNNCSRVLVCDHTCQANCTSHCPPCRRPCENRCAHGRCTLHCGIPCKPCAEPCEWKCRHHQCTRLCGEMCDRPPCNVPCTKLLKCGHRCIGLCGEPCPSKCRVCDEEEVTEIFFGDEDEPNARFVQLEDCGHVFEVEGLDLWMTMKQDDTDQTSKAIQMKKCPRCNVIIRKNLRYGNIIKELLRDLSAVKQRIMGDKETIEEKANDLKERVANSEELEKLDESAKQQLSDLLVQPGYLTSENVHAIENILNMMDTLYELKKAYSDGIREVFSSSTKIDMRCRLDSLTLKQSFNELITWLLTWKYQITDQALQDAEVELSRLNLIVKMYILEAGLRKHKIDVEQKGKSALQRLHNAIESKQLMSTSKIDAWKEYVKKVHSSYDVFKPLTTELKAQINKAMGLSKGHWFKCPQGHYYVIGDCGGATHTSKCPDCGSTVGGTSHALAAGNEHAPEMDGSRYAAYSEAANMDPRNFDMDNLW